MEANIQIFRNSAFGEVRVAGTSEQPMFCLADVCKVLGLESTNKVKARLNINGLQLLDLHGGNNIPGVSINNLGNSKATFISESNLYKCIFQSRKPEAEQFQDWVTTEILPSIRKHGAYMTNEVIAKTLTDPDYLIQLATTLKDERAKRIEAEKQTIVLLDENEEQRKQIKEQAPVVEYAQKVLASEDGTPMTYVAAEFGMGYKKFTDLLRLLGIAYTKGGSFHLYAPYIGKGYTKSRTAPFTRSDGRQDSRTYEVWTEQGRRFLHDYIENRVVMK